MNERILIIEDESRLLHSIAFTLKRHGYAAIQAADAENGLRMINSNMQKPDLLITDINLPGMDGASFIEELMRQGIRIPTIVITAYGTMDLRRRLEAMGVHGILDKPFNINDLVCRVKSVLSEIHEKAVSL